MFDIHCHLLPALDDGPRNLNESLDLAEQAVEDGILKAIVTPHYLEETKNTVFINRFREEFERTREKIQESGSSLLIFPGAELFFYSAASLLACIEEPGLRVHETPFFIVELPMLELPSDLEDALFYSRLEGYSPILAHPERNRQVSQNPEILYPFVENGIYLQLDAGSLTGQFGPQVRMAAKKLLESNLVHFIGSDGHDCRNRPMKLGAAAEILEKWKMAKKIDKLVWENPEALIANGSVLPTGQIRHPGNLNRNPLGRLFDRFRRKEAV